jgi:fucose permease
MVNLVVLLRVPMPATVLDAHRTPVRTLLRTRAFAAAMLLMLCAGAAELTMSQWSSLFAEEGLGVSKVWGDIAGPCLFAIFMGAGRAAYGVWGGRIRLAPALVGCGALATMCYLVAAVAGNPVLSLIGCALCGLAVSLLWPGTFSLAAAGFPAGGAAMFGILAVFGDAGGAVGPWTAGAIAQTSTRSDGVLHDLAGLLPDDGGSGLRVGLLVGVVFPVIVVVLAHSVALRRRDESAERAEA